MRDWFLIGQMRPRRAIPHNGAVPESDPFARLRLTGGRFDRGTGMPVEALAELVEYRELVLGVARALFLRAHPHRKRMPRRFFDRLQLRLGVVEEGSQMPVLHRLQPLDELAQAPDYFTMARDTIEDTVKAAGDGTPLPEAFPLDKLALFNRFGQTLEPGEAIELRRGAAQSGPRYTTTTRRELIRKEHQTYQDKIRDLGRVAGVDADHMVWDVQLRMGPSAAVSAPLDGVTFELVKNALEAKGQGPPLAISGVGVFNAAGTLIRVASLTDVDELDDPDAPAIMDKRLDELAELKAGWLDGDGEPPANAALGQAKRLLGELIMGGAPRPQIFPTLEGGVQAEWAANGNEISIAFEPDGATYAISVDRASGDATEFEGIGENPEQIISLFGVDEPEA